MIAACIFLLIDVFNDIANKTCFPITPRRIVNSDVLGNVIKELRRGHFPTLCISFGIAALLALALTP